MPESSPTPKSDPAVPPTLDYRSPKSEKKAEIGSFGAPQAIFDTVTGPNLRLKDNLIQLACVVVSVILGTLITLLFVHDFGIALLIGIFCGLLFGIIISGAVLGIYRFVKTVKRK